MNISQFIRKRVKIKKEIEKYITHSEIYKLTLPMDMNGRKHAKIDSIIITSIGVRLINIYIPSNLRIKVSASLDKMCELKM